MPLAIAAALVIGGCDDASSPDGDDGPVTGGAAPDLPPTSDNAALKLKAGLRFRNDVAQALDLDPLFCSELGLADCAAVHFIIMGGADAFGSGLYQPLPETTATSPLAFDRLAVAGCLARTTLDLDTPESARVFIDLEVDADGRMDPQAPAAAAAVERLYQKGLARNPTPAEVEAVVGLYDAIDEQGSESPARDWATLGCFAVLTTMENVFY
ncbi:MAG: hypothetical protein JNK04_22190 [Myxococcales bacterium]|nr:hypothetical protein [Myxococcales bacterium]